MNADGFTASSASASNNLCNSSARFVEWSFTELKGRLLSSPKCYFSQFNKSIYIFFSNPSLLLSDRSGCEGAEVNPWCTENCNKK